MLALTSYAPAIILKSKFDVNTITVNFSEVPNWSCYPVIIKQADNLWQQKVIDYKAKGINVWDGDFYRLDNLQEVSKLAKDQKIHLDLSIIKYRYVNTYRDFQDYYDAHPESNLNHVSIGAMLKTADGFWVFGQRAKARTSTTDVDIIGGGLNKSELEITSGADIHKQLLNELHEEAGILPEVIQSCQGIGMLHSSVSNVVIIAEVELNATCEELKEIFKNRTEDEMQDLLFIKDEEVKEYLRGMTSYRTLIPEVLE